MKKFLFYIMLILCFTSFVSIAKVKKLKYDPAGKKVFIFNEYSSSAINQNEYNGLYTSPNAKSLFYPSYKKYKGMEGYIDKDVRVGHNIYQKVILKNGKVFYLEDFNSYDQLESIENYEKRLNEIKKLKKFKFPNIDELSVTKVVMEPKDIYKITFSNGLTLSNHSLYGLLRLSKKIKNPDDFRHLIDIINTDKIDFTYDPYNNLAKIWMESKSLQINIILYQEKLYSVTAKVVFNGYNWIYANKFKIYQNGNKYNSPVNLLFQRESGNIAYEWHNFILKKDFFSCIKSLDNSQDAIIRFYGSRGNADRTIEPETITKMKKMLVTSKILAKYFKLTKGK